MNTWPADDSADVDAAEDADVFEDVDDADDSVDVDAAEDVDDDDASVDVDAAGLVLVSESETDGVFPPRQLLKIISGPSKF